MCNKFDKNGSDIHFHLEQQIKPVLKQNKISKQQNAVKEMSFCKIQQTIPMKHWHRHRHGQRTQHWHFDTDEILRKMHNSM